MKIVVAVKGGGGSVIFTDSARGVKEFDLTEMDRVRGLDRLEMCGRFPQFMVIN